MNSLVLVGVLISEPELSYTAKGKQITKFRLKVPRGDYADEFDITAFGKTAESIVTNGLTTGQRVGIKGEVQTSSFEKDGKTITRLQVVAWNVEVLD